MNNSTLNGARILVAEDEPLIVMELTQMIEEAGGIVAGSARSREEAMLLADESNAHAALLDVRLRDGTTFDVAAKLAARGIPFLFCTADNEDRGQFHAWPDVPIIAKPHQAGLVVDTLSRLLHSRP
jgi:CheY-like chemotaxis protein